MMFQLDNKMEAIMKLDGVTFILTLYCVILEEIYQCF